MPHREVDTAELRCGITQDLADEVDRSHTGLNRPAFDAALQQRCLAPLGDGHAGLAAISTVVGEQKRPTAQRALQSHALLVGFTHCQVSLAIELVK